MSIRLHLAAALACGLFSASALSAQSLLHEWRFPATSRSSLEAFGWSGWGSLAARPAAAYTSIRLDISAENSRLGVHHVAGASGDTGVLFAHTGASLATGSRHDRFVATTTFPPLQLQADRLGYLVWSQASTNTSSTVRVLVRVEGSWYSSAEQFKVARGSGAGSMTNLETKSFDLAGPSGLGTTRWHPTSFGPDAAIVRQQVPVPSPIGTTLDGIGFLIMSGDAVNRVVFIDDVALLGAPTPAAAATAP